jgi:hypothetical protein
LVYESPENHPVERTLADGTKISLGRRYRKVSARQSTIPRAGKGLIAMEPIQAHDFISHYKGEKIAMVDAIRLLEEVFTRPIVPGNLVFT